MIEYLKGILAEKNPAYLVIEAGGVGYYVNISLGTYSKVPEAGVQVKVLVHQIIREDAQLLYGFADAHERDVFRKLLSVSGIGANTARTILSSLEADAVRACIIGGDVNAFKNVKGIGLKTAQRIIVDLKDKMGERPAELPSGGATSLYDGRREALDALEVLGFARKTTEKVVDDIIKGHSELSVEQLIKLALKNI